MIEGIKDDYEVVGLMVVSVTEGRKTWKCSSGSLEFQYAPVEAEVPIKH